MPPPTLMRRLFAEFLGTGLLVTVMVGAGFAAGQLSPDNAGLQLLEISTACGIGLAVLILVFGPVSGAHFNPAVSVADWFLGRRAGTGLSTTELGGYVLAQCVGGIGGALLADGMYSAGLHISDAHRASGGHLLGEVVATAGLVLVAFSLGRTNRAAAAPAVGAYLAAAFWFTSSTAFANPAVTIGRIFTDAITGIAPASVLAFILMQLIGAAVAVATVLVLYPDVAVAADDVVVPHTVDTATAERS
jgi:glycerol uptake facilitator-like aquaporin